MRLSRTAFCITLLLGVHWPLAGMAEIRLPAEQMAVESAFQRLPGSTTAVYRDSDATTEGAADSRWKPGNPRHLRMARDAAQGPTGTVRDAVRYAYLLSLKGDRSLALEELDKARQRFPANGAVFWSQGWIELNLGNYRGALNAWQHAETLHGGHPYWVPYSKALALTGLGDLQAAIAWWTVAQRSQAPHLDSPRLARRHFRYWRPFERDLLDRLLAEVGNPPAPIATR